MNFTKPGMRVAAAIVAAHLAHYAYWSWQPIEDHSSAATVTVEAPEQSASFDSEGPQQEGGHREPAVGTSGSAAAHVTLTPAVAKFEAVPVTPEVPAPARVEAPGQSATFDSEGPQQEGGHREGSGGTSGGGRIVYGRATADLTFTAGGPPPSA